MSSNSVHGVFLFGILIATIMIAACFLGYSTTYGAMAHWALRVVMGLVRCIPYLDTWFYGNYAVSYAMLSKCLVFHFLIVMVALVLMILHLIMLHNTGSSAGSALTTAIAYHGNGLSLLVDMLLGTDSSTDTGSSNHSTP